MRIRTPAASSSEQFILGSPISSSHVSLKAHTLCESEAADVLLSLCSPRFKSLPAAVDDNAVVDYNIQASTQTDLSLSDAPGSPSFSVSGGNVHGSFHCTDIRGSSSDNISVANTTLKISIPHLRKEKTSKVDKILEALEELRNSSSRISVMDMILGILTGGHDEFYFHRLTFLCDIQRIRKLLDILWQEKNSQPAFESWINDVGINYVCELVNNEMESAKPKLQMKLDEVSSEYIEKWDVAAIMDPVAKVTPTWKKILDAASEPSRSESEDTRNRPTV